MSDDSHMHCCNYCKDADTASTSNATHCIRHDDCTSRGTDTAQGDNTSLHALRAQIAQSVRDVKLQTPLAQSFTNFVTINLVANAQLAAGGTAAMSFLPDDVIDTASISGADYINVGTLLPFYADALPQIARAFHKTGHKWVLDPVAAGIGKTRTEILRAFRSAPPTIVRGNASEIIALATMWGLISADDASRPAGVELVDEVDAAIEPAQQLASFLASAAPEHKAAVAVSGKVDLVTNGEHVYRLPGGSAMMAKITGAGCSLGGVTATYLAVCEPLVAALAASLLYNRAAEIAEAKADGPSSFQVHLLDALWNLTAEQVAESPIVVQ